ncbi:MAG: ABC transporter ATP-binding protein [Treponema sp.]|jgi:lipoprotein-releasing system ATP-binding protein|nr:ABC transporter ATP-binding protein [Treponema sp.]
MNNYIVEIKNLEKTYVEESESLTILKNLNLQIINGTKNIILGESGCGKSTLLNIIGGLDVATSGSIIAGNFDILKMDEQSLTEYRSKFLGLIFQFHYLLKDFTALENVFLPAYMIGMNKKEAMQRAKQLLFDVGLEHRLQHLPSQLSGGERQRVAVARSLMNDPQLILADEPTGNLDPSNAMLIGEVLFSMVEKYDKTLILVTHDQEFSKRADYVYKFVNGKLELELS